MLVLRETDLLDIMEGIRDAVDMCKDLKKRKMIMCTDTEGTILQPNNDLSKFEQISFEFDNLVVSNKKRLKSSIGQSE